MRILCGRIVSIKPVTRIEGHAKVSIIVDDDNRVREAYFHVLEFRGFERFLRGRPVEEAPIIIPRICGLCSVSHHLASVKAVDSIFGLEVDECADKLRLTIHLAGFMHSHLLHFFILYAPDLLLVDVPAYKRGFPMLVKRYPRLVRQVLRVRDFSRRVIEVLGGSPVHPTAVVPGGFAKPIDGEDRMKLLELAKDASKVYMDVLGLIKDFLHSYLRNAVNFQTNFLALYSESDLALYDSNTIRCISWNGDVVDEFMPNEYFNHISEYVFPWSYAKAPFISKLGYPEGIYRVGPLARFNIAGRIDSDWANSLMKEFSLDGGQPLNSSKYYNVIRLIELAYCFDKLLDLLGNSSIERCSAVRGGLHVKSNSGVGVVEAPRGTLIHHYLVDDEGLITDANLIVATVQNIPVICEEIKLAASKLIESRGLGEDLLFTVSNLIRDYDPCLSCSVHECNLPLQIEVLSMDGKIIARIPEEL